MTVLLPYITHHSFISQILSGGVLNHEKTVVDSASIFHHGGLFTREIVGFGHHPLGRGKIPYLTKLT